MFGNLIVDQPIEKFLGDWDLLEETVAKKFSTFRQAGQSIFGIRRRMVSADGIVDTKKGGLTDRFSISAAGIVGSPKEELVLHVITSGTPHHTAHNYGYWHINDKDELYLQMRGNSDDDLGYSLTIMGSPSPNDTDRLAWYCQTCGTMIHESMLRTGSVGFDHFWRWEEASVRDFNSDPHKRTCPECAEVHPLAYMWNPAKDTPQEHEARMAW